MGSARVWLQVASGLAVLFATALAWLYTLGPYRLVSTPRTLPLARPALFESRDDVDVEPRVWRAQRAALVDAFRANVYGDPPPDALATVIRREPIAPQQSGGVRGVEQWNVSIADVGRLNLVLVLPERDSPAPVIVMQNFCGNQAAFPGRPRAIAPPRRAYPGPCRSGVFDPLHRAVFGRWMLGPPFDQIGRRGYAIAMFYGGDVVPDEESEAAPVLASMGADTGAIAAWAWMHARVVDVLSADQRIDAHRIYAWGHSRFGKVALLAGALDERVAAVIAVQSGRGGDALTTHREGESVGSITRSYPHWFAPQFTAYARRDPPVDQHQLLALIAPRPILLGHARRDGWSDPVGAVAAAQGAEPAFALYGAPGPANYWRDGGHGIEDADWDAALDFLDHLQQADSERR